MPATYRIIKASAYTTNNIKRNQKTPQVNKLPYIKLRKLSFIEKTTWQNMSKALFGKTTYSSHGRLKVEKDTISTSLTAVECMQSCPVQTISPSEVLLAPIPEDGPPKSILGFNVLFFLSDNDSLSTFGLLEHLEFTPFSKHCNI